MFYNENIKKIINTYQLQYKNKIAQGFGDFLRGSFCLYEICKILNLEFDIDFSHHPIGYYFIKNIPTDNENYEYEYNPNIEWYDDCNYVISEKAVISKKESFLIDFITHINKLTPPNKTLHIGFNSFPITNTYINEAKLFIKSKILPSKEMSTYIYETLISLFDEDFKDINYNIIHLRTGDMYLVENKNINLKDLNIILREITDILKHCNTQQFILISDNTFVKNYIKTFIQLPNVKIISNKIAHLGLNTNNTDNSNKISNSIKDTLLDFFLMANANKIFSLTPYFWGSGFSEWCSIIFDVPFEKKIIKIDCESQLPIPTPTSEQNQNTSNYDFIYNEELAQKINEENRKIEEYINSHKNVKINELCSIDNYVVGENTLLKNIETDDVYQERQTHNLIPTEIVKHIVEPIYQVKYLNKPTIFKNEKKLKKGVKL